MSKSEPEMRILKSTSTKSISGKSSLKYDLGCSSDNTVYLRITSNSAAGQFSPEWIKIADIKKTLANAPEGQPLTSFLLQPLLHGRSTNTPAFLLAALTNERLLRVLKGKKRGHEFLDPEGFDTKIDRLVAPKAKPKGTVRKTAGGTTKRPTKKTGGNAAVKKKAASRRKTG